MSHLNANNAGQPEPPPPFQPRFSIRSVLLLMVVVGVMASGGNYLVRALQGGRTFQLAFVLFTLAAPLLVLVAVSLLHALFRPRR
jgi:hypothetical protein